MPLISLQFQPGIVRDVTARTAKGAWYDCNLVRFRLGYPEAMGGWQRLSPINTFMGTCRALHVWFSLGGARRLAIGTHRKYYLEFGQGLYDITPIRRTATLNGPFAVTPGSTTMVVTDSSHGAVEGTFVTFSGATSLGGVITDTVLDQEFEVTAITGPNTYTVELPISADVADVGTGGSSVVASYQVNPGSDTQVGGPGWGAGAWGLGGWGDPAPFNVDAELRLWAQDNFGEDLIYNVRNGGVFYWQNSLGLTVRGIRLADRVGADAETPTLATQVLVSDRDRHVIAFGANLGGTTAQDPMLIRFSDQQDSTTWIPTATNTAGDLRLGSGSRILRAIETKREILIWTDAALYSMRFIGPPFTFGVEQISSTTTAIGFNCFAPAEDAVYWMGRGTFWVYSGQVQELPCTVRRYVFSDINLQQSDKIYAGVNTQFGEVIWFYPSANSVENNRYVVYNYKDQVWYYGQLMRTAWVDCCPEPYPVAAGTDGRLYYHEFGADDGSQIPSAPIARFIQSAPVELQEGDQFMFIRRIIPDVTFNQSSGDPLLSMEFTVQNFPGAFPTKTTAVPVVPTAVIPIDRYTNQVHTRLRGRAVSVNIKSNTLGTQWQLGTPRIDAQPDGRR